MREKPLHSGVKAIGITVITQALILALSIITGFILPNKMGTEMYGYWQKYLFYLNYLNLFGLGFNDGIALYYGGCDYKNLPFERLRAAMRFLIAYLFAATVLLCFVFSFVHDEASRTIFWMLALSVPLTCLQCVVLTVFLSVNRTIVYNIILLVTKILASVLYVSLILFDITYWKYVIYADFAARFITTVVCLYLGRQFIFGKSSSIKSGINEFAVKAKAGIQITLALIAASFTPICGRMIVEWNESVPVYGVYSFAMSLLVIIMVFTTTAGTVIFPLLKRLPSEKLPDYYPNFSFACSGIIYCALFAYAPLLYIIRTFMPEYVSALNYTFILMAMCVPLAKMQLLLTPYYKAMRLEKAFLYVNGLGFAGMLMATGIAYSIFHTVLSVAVASTVMIVLWTFFSERYITANMHTAPDFKNAARELAMMLLFILAGSFQSITIFSLIYGCALIVFGLLYRNRIKDLLRKLK